MNDPAKFKAPFIPRERIWQETEKLRAAHPAGRKVPVPVLELAEFDLGLELIPAEGLREELEIDALLMGDLKSILVDRRAFMNPRIEYRLRFSVAHEIGHLILHQDIYGRQKHASAKGLLSVPTPTPKHSRPKCRRVTSAARLRSRD